jgi:selenide, water dikinase
LPEDAYAEMLASMTLLNRVGQTLAQDEDVHAMTDVTGFGLLGHGLEMARGSGAILDIDFQRIPFLTQAASLAEAGFATGASGRNWASYGEEVVLPPELQTWQRTLLTDPQTSGGLLVACAPRRAASILAAIKDAGYPSAAMIGSVAEGNPAVRVCG